MVLLQLGSIISARRNLKIIGHRLVREPALRNLLIVDQYPKPTRYGRKQNPNQDPLGPDRQIEALGSTRASLLEKLVNDNLHITGKFFIVTHIDEHGISDVPRHLSDQLIGLKVQARECNNQGLLKRSNPITILFYHNAERPDSGVFNPNILANRPLTFGKLAQ